METLPLPFYLNAILTQRCNLNCIMCHEQGNPKSRELELSTDQLCKLIDNAGPVKVAAVTGGEISSVTISGIFSAISTPGISS